MIFTVNKLEFQRYFLNQRCKLQKTPESNWDIIMAVLLGYDNSFGWLLAFRKYHLKYYY